MRRSENERTHTSADGVVFVQKTSKIHIGSLLNKIQSVANVGRPDGNDVASSERQNDADTSRRVDVSNSRRGSIESSQSSRLSFNDDDQKLKRHASPKKRHAPVPPASQEQLNTEGLLNVRCCCQLFSYTVKLNGQF